MCHTKNGKGVLVVVQPLLLWAQPETCHHWALPLADSPISALEGPSHMRPQPGRGAGTSDPWLLADLLLKEGFW